MASLARNLDRMRRSVNRLLVPRLLAHRCDRVAMNPEAMRCVAVYPRLRIAYNRIKKNANSTTVVLLRELEAGCVENEREAKLHSLHLEKMPVSIAAIVSQWTFFTIVRNPYTRVLSAFFNKFEKEAYRRQFGDFELSAAGFHRFVYWLRDGALVEDPHWDLQVKLLFMPLAAFDTVIRFEDYAEQLRRFLGERGVPSASVPRANPRGDTQLAACYTPEVARIVAGLYERDFDELGYPSRFAA